MTAKARLDYLRKIVPSWGQEFIEGTLLGDPVASSELSSALHDYQRAPVTALMFGHIAPAAFRELLSTALTQTHGYLDLRCLAGSRSRFMSWCRYAEFELPTLPAMVTVYRGSRDNPPKCCARQLSWSLDFDCAAFFAVSLGAQAPSGFVVEAQVPSSKIVFFSDDRREQEVIFETAPRRFQVHDDQRVLRDAAKQYEDRTRWRVPGMQSG